MGVWADKIARMASAEGETDADILRHHRAHLLLAAATAILEEGSTAGHRARAAEKIMAACSGPVNLECTGVSRALAAAYNSISAAADDAEVGPSAALLAQRLDVVSLTRVAGGGDEVRRYRADQMAALLEDIRMHPESVYESLRRLGTALTVPQLELFTVDCLSHAARPGDPIFSQRVALRGR